MMYVHDAKAETSAGFHDTAVAHAPVVCMGIRGADLADI